MTTGLVAQLARQPGQKEQRFVHLLAVESGNTDQIAALPEQVMIERVSAHTRLEALEQSVTALREEIEQLKNDFSSFKKHFE
jgi:uncharacterized protein YceH (UPF0502 family)